MLSTIDKFKLMATGKLKLSNNGLTTSRIDSMLRNNAATKKYYVGTFPSCLSVKTNKRDYCFITNTDNHEEPGEHWNCWFVRGRNIIFFDSFGRELSDFPEHYLDIIKEYDNIEYTRTRVQGWLATTCGYYCLHFAYLMSLGLNFQSFLNDYNNNNHELNDKNVVDIVNSIY